MTSNSCPSCNAELTGDFRFCPQCGQDLQKPLVCPDCSYENESNSNFCQECGRPLRGQISTATKKARSAKPKSAVVEIEPPPSNGISIEFPYSTAQSFDFAVEAARQIATFRQFGEAKKAIYRVTFQPTDLGSATELLEHLKGWRKRVVYVDGEKVTWDSVFSFSWCYARKGSSFKPEFYCFGYDNDYNMNIWGCIQPHLSFVQHAEWFCWGRWLNQKGDWEFDKARIRHELEKALYPYRFCPALQPELVETALSALPNKVNPFRDKNWEAVERWGDDSLPGLKVTVTRFGYKQEVVVKGVSPSGPNALKEVAKRMRLRLPERT